MLRLYALVASLIAIAGWALGLSVLMRTLLPASAPDGDVGARVQLYVERRIDADTTTGRYGILDELVTGRLAEELAAAKLDAPSPIPDIRLAGTPETAVIERFADHALVEARYGVDSPIGTVRVVELYLVYLRDGVWRMGEVFRLTGTEPASLTPAATPFASSPPSPSSTPIGSGSPAPSGSPGASPTPEASPEPSPSESTGPIGDWYSAVRNLRSETMKSGLFVVSSLYRSPDGTLAEGGIAGGIARGEYLLYLRCSGPGTLSLTFTDSLFPNGRKLADYEVTCGAADELVSLTKSWNDAPSSELIPSLAKNPSKLSFALVVAQKPAQ